MKSIQISDLTRYIRRAASSEFSFPCDIKTSSTRKRPESRRTTFLFTLLLLFVHSALPAQTDPGTNIPGTVFGWGSGYYGQSSVYGELRDVIAISAGGEHSLALLSNQTVIAWGNPYQGQTAVPSGLNGVKAISAGAFHNLALKYNGTIVGWGRGNKGQTTAPEGLTNAIAIAAGTVHSLALTSNRTVVAWGVNDYGQTSVPPGLNNVTAIAAGSHHCLALKSDGTAVGWGWNEQGQATPPAGLTNVIAIAAGTHHSLALKSDGTVVGWGYNQYGQATAPPGLSGVTAIDAGRSHSMALKSDGTVVTWGQYFFGGLSMPEGLRGVSAIAAGDDHGLALQSSPTNKTPIDILLSPKSIIENEPIGTTVGILSVVDPDPGDTHTLAIVDGPGDTANSYVTLVGNTLKTSAKFAYGTRGDYFIRVQATDASGFLFAKILTITVEPPSLRILTDSSLGFSNGLFKLSIVGTNGANVVVQGTTNLVDWTPISTNVLGSTPLLFSDPEPQFPQRFYRAVIP